MISNNLQNTNEDLIPGLNLIYVAKLADIQEISSTSNDKEMDTVVMKTNPLTTAPYFWYRISFKKGTAGFNNEGVFGNNVYFNQTLTFNAEDITKDSLEFVESIINTELVFIVKDNQNKYHVLGRKGGLNFINSLKKNVIKFLGSEPELSNLIKAGVEIQVLDGNNVVTINL